MSTTPTTHPGAGFLADAAPDEAVEAMFAGDRELQGYVANQTRLWAHSPEALGLLSYVLRRAVDAAGLDARQRALLVTATASALGDAYCSLAFGTKLAAGGGVDVATAVLTGDDQPLDERDRVLARWARRVVRDPNATTAPHVAELRGLGYDDRQVFMITLFVALRIAFSTVNDALGATPDAELADRAPAAVRASVDFGRAPGPVAAPAR